MESSPSRAPARVADPAFDTARTDLLLYGRDRTERIVAVEPVGPDRVAIVEAAADGQRIVSHDAFAPWLVAERAEPWAALRGRPTVTPLAGDHRLRYLVRFATWSAFSDAAQAGRDAGELSFRFRSRVEQYLVQSGKTLFKGMVYDDLRRLQLDIETTGLNPATEEIVAIALQLVDGPRTATDYLDRLPDEPEAALLARLNERIAAWDPDVIEGHNLFNFDIPFLAARAQRFGLALSWGRDGSPVGLGQNQQRFKVGALTLPFTPAWVFGRHVVDTYQQIQRYDVAGRLSSYALKRVMKELGLEREDRAYVPAAQIRDLWRDPEGRRRLRDYALDDVRDVDALSRLAVPTEFYQTQLLPRSFQSVATGGPGEKINDLMVRAYLMLGHSIPTAQRPRPYPGGHAELLATGSFSPVVKCDVESLYPSIMLAEAITAESDVLDAYLPMLADLTRRRLGAKAKTRVTAGAERAMWEGLQSSFKVLINSFYGYLGYGGALFNDYAAAERVTLAGQRIIKGVVDRLHATGGTPIEVDTDGVYFVPPPEVSNEDGERAYVTTLGAALPAGIRLAHDGRYAGMLSLRLKNYALLDYEGTVLLRGSSLRSRRMEACFREFLGLAAAAFLRGQPDDVRTAYFALGERIRNRELRVAEFSQWGMVNDETKDRQVRLKRLLDRLPDTVRGGERLELYERQDGELALAAEYDQDENIGYLLRRLRDTAERFRAIFPSDSEFEAFFPSLTARTDLAAAKAQQHATQLGLFG